MGYSGIGTVYCSMCKTTYELNRSLWHGVVPRILWPSPEMLELLTYINTPH